MYKTLSSSRYRITGVRLFWLLLVLLVSGCTAFVKKPSSLTDSEQTQRWETLQKQLAAIHSWQLTGRLGLKVPDRSGSMSLDWTQKNDAYTLFLDGPFGQSLAEIKGDHHRVVADVAGRDELLVGASPEQIMLEITGWSLPVSGLQFWVRGLPVPNTESKVTLNGQGLPVSIFQQGWHITYTAYRDVHGIALPARIRVVRENVSMTMAIRSWSLTGELRPE
ncbi:lipoprotein insertase outer membrane protein LolB [Endozoicomonas sp.]|nr:lipoprotein insertase outer membrane protein LolB [Endozoicomonas sp.]